MASTTNVGQMDAADFASTFRAHAFQITQMLARVRTAMPVQVVAVHGGGVANPPTVDVQPLVNMLDGAGNATKHGVVFGLPVMRLQGGVNAAIIDPVVNDFGIALFCDRDISNVVAKPGIANPGSLRKHDMADGVYLGALLNGPPTNYVAVTGNELDIVHSASIRLTAPLAEIDASTAVTLNSPTDHLTGSLQVDGSGTIAGNATIGGNLAVAGATSLAGILDIIGGPLVLPSGGTGPTGATIKRILSGSVTAGPFLIGAGGTAIFTINVPGAQVGDVVAVTPNGTIGSASGTTLSSYVSSSGTVTCTLATFNAVTYSVPSATYQAIVLGTT